MADNNIYASDQMQLKPIADVVESRANSLAINIPDEILADIIDDRLKDSVDWYTKNKDLYNRQEKNYKVLMGRQFDGIKKKKYKSSFQDNTIWEGEATIKPIALSRMPDIIVSAGDPNNPLSIKSAEDLTKVVDSDIKKRESRKALATAAVKHNPTYFIGVLKPRWDKNKGKNGDYVFDVVHPKNIVLDRHSPDKNVHNMDFIGEVLDHISIKDLLIQFPKKKEDIYKEFNIDPEKPDYEKRLASKVKIWEIHFIQHINDTPTECVCWKYNKLILDKMKDPNWDWEGKETTFINGNPAGMEDLQNMFQSMSTGGMMPQGITREKVYRNYLEQPTKPYILIGYDEWGEMPYDETSRIEQALPLQEDLDKRGRQITETADRSRGKHAWSSEAGIKKEDIQNLDVDDPDKDLFMNGDVTKVHKYIEGLPVNPVLYEDKKLTKDAIFGKLGTNSTTRGIVESDTATTAQIAREADFGRIDDFTEETINAAAEQMARWALHFIKLRYTEEHFKRVLGKDGTTTAVRILSDMVEDGMEVTVSASGVDKARRKQQALEMAKINYIDPISFFEDIEAPNPKQRAERLVMYLQDPMGYVTKYIMGMDSVQSQVNGLNQANQNTQTTPVAPNQSQMTQPQPQPQANPSMQPANQTQPVTSIV